MHTSNSKLNRSTNTHSLNPVLPDIHIERVGNFRRHDLRDVVIHGNVQIHPTGKCAGALPGQSCSADSDCQDLVCHNGAVGGSSSPPSIPPPLVPSPGCPFTISTSSSSSSSTSSSKGTYCPRPSITTLQPPSSAGI